MTQIQLRRGDTAASWASTNPVLALGEVGYETDTLRTKIGNGIGTGTGINASFDMRSISVVPL